MGEKSREGFCQGDWFQPKVKPERGALAVAHNDVCAGSVMIKLFIDDVSKKGRRGGRGETTIHDRITKNPILPRSRTVVQNFIDELQKEAMVLGFQV